MSNEQAIIRFTEAREHYVACRFHEARAAMRRYQKNVNYETFKRVDHREASPPEISIIIVSYGTEIGLIECLETVLEQQGPAFEIIVVDNGRNETIHNQLRKLPLLWIAPPLNLLPGEGRNVGANFAKSELLVFLDDDALMGSDYLEAANSAMAEKARVGLRGRIRPKTGGTESPPHYDLGDAPLPSEFNLEGNMVIRKSAFNAIGGFDPLMFGHEGKFLTHHTRLRFPKKEIQYRPELSIQHDWAHDDRLAEKHQRQALGKAYLEYCRERKLDEGASIIINAKHLPEAQQFIKDLIKHNTYKPLEVCILTPDTKAALNITRPFLLELDVRVMPSGVNGINDAIDFLKYEHVLMADLPHIITQDVVEEWISKKCKNQNNLRYFNKRKIIKEEREPETNIAYAKKLKKRNPIIVNDVGDTHPPKHGIEPLSMILLMDLMHNRITPTGSDLLDKINFTEQRVEFIEQYIHEKEDVVESIEASLTVSTTDILSGENITFRIELMMMEISRALLYLWNTKDLLHQLRMIRPNTEGSVH